MRRSTSPATIRIVTMSLARHAMTRWLTPWLPVVLLVGSSVLWESNPVRAQDQTAAPTNGATATIRVYPSDPHLSTARDRQSLVVQIEQADGLTRDVTPEVSVTAVDPAIVKVDGNRLLPVADGTTQVKVMYAGQTIDVPVRVERAGEDAPISFRLDVMPVFMKAGCNTGSCHGAARGKDGFRLSLFGFDPEGDYYRLTRELNGRRVNLGSPSESLLIEKSLGRVPHTGGSRFKEDSDLCLALDRWLKNGALNDAGPTPAVVAVEIYPERGVLDGQDATQQLTVRAKYADGTDRDVTSLAYFMSGNDNSAIVSQSGLVTAGSRGEAFIMARFGTHTVGAHYIVLPKNLEFSWRETPENNFIDTLVHQKLRKLRIQPSELASDDEFLRRVTLDITGTLPTVEQYERFVASSELDKRARAIDELLDRKEFVEVWVMKWAELLQIRTTQQVSYKSMLRYYNWLQDRIATNVPIDQMVRELLGASGGTFANAATNYYQNERDTLKVSENVAQVFMGMRVQCAQCHNHPFDRWTMDDYYQLAAFFSQIGRKPAEDPREIIVFNSGSGDIRHPLDNRVMSPKFLGGDVPNVEGKDRRVVLAQWLASPENPFFARNLVNIVWAHFLGRGIIDPVDDVRVSNPAVNPELLDELARRFTESNYDFKQLVREICNSRTYQLSTTTNATNETDDLNFSHAVLRRLRAEVLLDSITQVTATKNKFPGLPNGARAVQIANGGTSTYFLTTFGRASRETACSCEVVMEPNLSQALHLLNGETVNQKIQQGGLIPTLLAEGKTPEQVVEGLYIRCLCRKPTDKERQTLNAILSETPDTPRSLDDLFWALLNSSEYLFNH